MKVLEKIYCAVLVLFLASVFPVGVSWAGIWTAQHFWWGKQEYAIWLRHDDPGPQREYYISHITRDSIGYVTGEKEIYRGRDKIDEIITGGEFFGPGKGVVAFLNVQNKGYLTAFRLLKFDPIAKKLTDFHCQQVSGEGSLLTEYEGNLMFWRGLQPHLVLLNKKKQVKFEKCLIGIIPNGHGGIFIEVERKKGRPASFSAKWFSGKGKELKMTKGEKLPQPVILGIGQSLILLRKGNGSDPEKLKVENENSQALEYFDPGLPNILTASEPGVSRISIGFGGKVYEIMVIVVKMPQIGGPPKAEL